MTGAALCGFPRCVKYLAELYLGGGKITKGRPKGSKNKSKRPLTLSELYKDDPVLLDLYRRKLPLRGWAGAKMKEEREYVKHG